MSSIVSPWKVAAGALNETRETWPLKMLAMIGKPPIDTDGRADRWNVLCRVAAIFDSAMCCTTMFATTNNAAATIIGASSQRISLLMRKTSAHERTEDVEEDGR